MSYQPFLIAPFGTGLDTDVAPWQLPQDAFSSIINGHIKHGVVEKREGFEKLADLVHQDQTNWKISNISAADPAVVTVVSTSGLAEGDIVEIRNASVTTQVNGNQYVVASLGATTFELENVDLSDASVTGGGQTGDVYLIPKNRVMGIERYIDSGGGKEVIAFDTTRAAKLDAANEVFNPLDSADIMSGTSNDYIWTANWASTASSTDDTLYRLYFTNGIANVPSDNTLNGIRYYDGGSTTKQFNPPMNGGRIINGCKLIFAFKQRLLLLHTTENAKVYPQRVRWCQVQNPGVSGAFTTEWDDATAGKGGFVDAPTGDHIVSAQFIQDVLIVFFTNSVWTLRATSDPALPFRWDKINDFRAADGKRATTGFDRYAVAAGIRGITGTDGIETQRIDERIEDFVNEDINDDEFEKVFSKRSYAERRMWMLYPSGESTEADGALIYDEESSSYSIYDISMNVLGYGGDSSDKKIDDFGDKTIDGFSEDTLKSYFMDGGTEQLIGGDITGQVFEMEQGGDDSETLFSSTILSVSQADPGVVTMNGSEGLSNGDTITISDIATGSMVELNDREFVVGSKSGNSFSLVGEDTSGYAAYVSGSGGTVGTTSADSILFSLTSAAWNPWMQEGKQSQLGYIDLFMDTHPSTKLSVEFYTNNDDNPYLEKSFNLLPNLREIAAVTDITNANPGNVTAGDHGLSTDDQIYIYGVEGMDAVNGIPYTITRVDDNNFTIGVDTTNFGLYKNSGVVTELPFASGKAWKRIYAGGTGYQHKLTLVSNGKDRPVRIHAFMPWFKPRSVRPI